MLLALTSVAAAFSPEVHRAISERAVELELGSADVAEAVGSGAIWEDLNFLRKWGLYHHYHSPEFEVADSRRRPSHERVEGLREEIARAMRSGQEDRAWDRLGHAVHHVQDMASPPHVVPVEHGFFDGFESYDMAAMVQAARGEAVPAMDVVAAQGALARDTLSRLEGAGLRCDDRVVPFSAFWIVEPGTFGHHGPETFGAVAGCERATEDFVRERVDRAVAYTRAAVRHALAQRGGGGVARASAAPSLAPSAAR